MQSKLSILLPLTLLCLSHLAAAQHDHGMEDMPAFNATGDEPMSYWDFPDNKGLLYTHILFMILAFWILMPMGIAFGIARSSFHVPTQILAFGTALVGFSFAKAYGHSVPHFYAGNIHHSMGWFLFLILWGQVLVGVVRKIANAVARSRSDAHYDRLETVHLVGRAESSSSSSSDSHHQRSQNSEDTLNDHEDFQYDKDNIVMSPVELEDPEFPSSYEEPEEKPTIVMRAFNVVSPFIPSFIKKVFVVTAHNPFTVTICRWAHLITGRVFPLLIFIQTLSGMVVYAGVCRGWEVLGCIAHLIKGGIFFIYGILTFARYLGVFADRGWAWNRVDNGSKFSFEMIECGLIFTYGITNTWMEHFGENDAWTHKDFEHASLAFMWWWSGLTGILIESRSLRRLLYRAVNPDRNEVQPRHEQEQSYSLNPVPALTVLMTGISMGNHHQDTQYSSNVHYLWGLLLSVAALCRMFTYISLYKSKPTSREPSRPPTEALGAFALICGSILFMASNSGTMAWMMRNQVDSMFMMNVAVAFSMITLSYVFSLILLKAWSAKREELKKLKKVNARSQRHGPLREDSGFEA
ncbi:hypothetical protein BGW37DRAFT_498671 [Umbelopsis sp. PMI_123]|nr:hypothetical protein BGW37DRAFT_498671 [Umbelopsis sp. PMI_123]